jgi:hypothetical protein
VVAFKTQTPDGTTGTGKARATLTLQELLTLCAGCGYAPGEVDSEAGPGLEVPLSLRLEGAMADAVKPLVTGLFAYLHALQRVTGCALRVVYPTDDDLARLPSGDLGPSPLAGRRHFATALKLQRDVVASTAGPTTQSTGDPCRVLEVAASDQGI